MKVIFLDIDGVLNSNRFLKAQEQSQEPPGLSFEWWVHQLDPSAVERLSRLIEVTGARVIVSSSWRVDTGSAWLQQVLAAKGFKGEVVGVTPRLEGDIRCEEIRESVKFWKPEAFVILDDGPDAEIEGHFVQTDPDVGLTEEDIQEAAVILAGLGENEPKE